MAGQRTVSGQKSALSDQIQSFMFLMDRKFSIKEICCNKYL